MCQDPPTTRREGTIRLPEDEKTVLHKIHVIALYEQLERILWKHLTDCVLGNSFPFRRTRRLHCMTALGISVSHLPKNFRLTARIIEHEQPVDTELPLLARAFMHSLPVAIESPFVMSPLCILALISVAVAVPPGCLCVMRVCLRLLFLFWFVFGCG